MNFLHTSAIFNADRTHRYSLTRTWDRTMPRVVWIMLNPSTADEHELDPTIRRCVGFAQRDCYGSLEVVNLFSLRSTDPQALYAGHNIGDDATNDAAILGAVRRAQCIIGAWGVHGAHRNRGRNVQTLLNDRGYTIHCLGTTKDGHPKHPLYLAGNTPLSVL